MGRKAPTNVGGNWRELAGFYAKSRQNAWNQGLSKAAPSYNKSTSTDYTVASIAYDEASRDYDAAAMDHGAAATYNDGASRGYGGAPTYQLTASTDSDKVCRG